MLRHDGKSLPSDLSEINIEEYEVLIPEKYMDKMQTMAKLLTIRDAWIGEWNPDSNVEKFTLTQSPYSITILAYTMVSRTFSFPTIKMAEMFRSTFHTELDSIKELL